MTGYVIDGEGAKSKFEWQVSAGKLYFKNTKNYPKEYFVF